MTLFVVPDSNTLFSDLFLEHPPVATILSAETTADVRLLLPSVVVDELRHHLEERLRKLAADARKHHRDLARLTGRERNPMQHEVTPDFTRTIMGRFDDRMQQFSSDGRVLPYPNISLSELALRSIRTQRPFSDKDRGLRDTLIWLSIKDYLNAIKGTSSTVILVTKDEVFYEERGKDAPSAGLTSEMEDAAIPQDSFQAERELQTVIDKHISKLLANAHLISEQIEGGAVAGFRNGDSIVLNAVNDWLIDHGDILQSLAQGYPIQGFQPLTYVCRTGAVRALVLDDGKVTVSSDWRGDLPVVFSGGRAEIHFADLLSRGAHMEVTIGSQLESEEDQWSVRSHEITRVQIGMY